MMKLRSYLLFLTVLLAVGLPFAPGRADNAAPSANSLTVEVNSEKPSNLFWDSETMDTHKPILLSWRVSSSIAGESKVQISWRLLDAAGKKVFSGSQKYNIGAGDFAAGRQLFSPKKRGAYLWVVRAEIKLDGPDLDKTAAMPLAVITAPQAPADPLLSVDTSSQQDSLAGDFYRLLGESTFTAPPATQYFSLLTAQFSLPSANVGPAARRRIIWYDKSRVKGAAFTLHDGDESTLRDVSPRDSAVALAQNLVMAHAASASGYRVSLDSAHDGQIRFASANDSTDQLIPWERAAASTAANRLLGKSQFVKELFSETPAVYAALFQSANSSIATVWSNQDNEGRLELHLPGVSLLDVDGNQIAQAGKTGDLKIPLTHDFYYVQADVPPQTLARALRAAAINGMPPVRAQVLPLTQPVSGNSAGPIRVLLQNITPHPCSGVVDVSAPENWTLDRASQQFVLQPGQWRVYQFKVNEAKQSYSYQTRVKVRVNNGVTGNWSWSVEPPLAVADNWPAKSTFKLDGSLDDWKDAFWMKVENDRFDRKAALAVRWDARNLYIAARVQEPRFTARENSDGAYHFWNGDAIQLGFGWREEPWMQPSGANFRDTDYGFVLAPFGRMENGSIDGRVLLLWNPTVPFNGTSDQVRWGGAVNGASCRITFDPKKKEAVYEATIPLSTLGNLDPQSRITSPDQPIRFSWIAHTFDGVAVQWSKAAGVFPWWGNSGSFLPVEKGYLAAQTLLGFSQQGQVEKTKVIIPPAKTPPGNSTPPLPPMPPQGPMNPSPPQNQVPSLPFPVPVQPIPPNLLPPAPPES
jgi:hypothetical protein